MSDNTNDTTSTLTQMNPEDILPQDTLEALKQIPDWTRRAILQYLFYKYLKKKLEDMPDPQEHISIRSLFFDLQTLRRQQRESDRTTAAWQRKIEAQIAQFQQEIQKAVQDSLMETENILLELQAGKMKPNQDTTNLVMEVLEGHNTRLKTLEIKAGLRLPQNPQNPPQK